MTNFKAMDFNQFKKLVKIKGYKIVSTSKHHAIVTLDDEIIMVFAIYHSKGSKKYVKAEYVKRFYNKTTKK